VRFGEYVSARSSRPQRRALAARSADRLPTRTPASEAATSVRSSGAVTDAEAGQIGLVLQAAKRGEWRWRLAPRARLPRALVVQPGRGEVVGRRPARSSCDRQESPLTPISSDSAERSSSPAPRSSAAKVGGVQRFSSTERRWNRTIQAEGCSALPVLKTGCVTDSRSLSESRSGPCRCVSPRTARCNLWAAG